jgi:SAM-dependent methyltransferase
VRRAHFDRFRPICTVCALSQRPPSPLAIGHVEREDETGIVEGALVCPQRRCRFEFPIIAGIPILTADVRGSIAEYQDELRARDDLSPWLESILGDCTGPESRYAVTRQHLASYGRGHWGDHDPERPLARGETVLGVVDAALALAGPPRGAWLDLGCSFGRASVELVARGADLVLGVDIHLAKLLAARRILATERARYPRRRTGVVYDRVDVPVAIPDAAKIDLWACDAAALPLLDGAADGALSLHVIDSIRSPIAHLRETGRVLRAGAPAVFASPYDWSASATPFEGWIAGHSQRTPHGGDSATELRRLLSPDDAAGLGSGLALTAETDDVPWPVHLHERATMSYRVHVALARKRG